MGIPVTLTLTLTQIAKVILEGDAHITRALGMGMPKTRGCPYHCNIGSFWKVGDGKERSLGTSLY